MITQPFDMTVPQVELDHADAWWSSLSINEMKSYRDKYFPMMDWNLRPRWIHQIWEVEGKPT